MALDKLMNKYPKTVVVVIALACGILIETNYNKVNAQESKCISALRQTRSSIPIATLKYNDPNTRTYPYLEGNPFRESDTVTITLPDNRNGKEWMKHMLSWADYIIRNCRNVVLVQYGIKDTDWVDFAIWDGKKTRQKECIFSGGRLTPQQQIKYNSNPWRYYICPG